jgi:hypothetical protein
MVLSVLEADVPQVKWNDLKITFQQATILLPSQICETLLIQSVGDPDRWKIVTIMHGKKYAGHVQDDLPLCNANEIFRAIGIEPEQILYNVILKASELDLGSDVTETPVSEALVQA